MEKDFWNAVLINSIISLPQHIETVWREKAWNQAFYFTSWCSAMELKPFLPFLSCSENLQLSSAEHLSFMINIWVCSEDDPG